MKLKLGDTVLFKKEKDQGIVIEIIGDTKVVVQKMF